MATVMISRAKRRSSLRFTRLELRNWRNFTSVSMELQPRGFILGPNAAGKSNLLDAFRFVSELARPGSGGIQAAIERRDGFSSLRSLFARAPSDIDLNVWIGDDEIPDLWRYELKFNRVTKAKEAFPTVIQEAIFRYGMSDAIANQKRPAGRSDARDWRQTLLEQESTSKNFRDLQEFLASCRYLHVVPQIVRDRARARSDREDPFGGDLLRRMKEMPAKSRLPRLKRIGEALQRAVPQFEELVLEDDMQGVPHLYARYRNWREKASKQSETNFSDGTLRLIGLLWSMAERGGPLLLEEPELSLNDAVIAQLPRMLLRMQRLSGRQAIVTTHSNALLEDSGVGLREIHIIRVEGEGSKLSLASAEQAIVAQVEGGLTVAQAVLPLVRPREADLLGNFDVAA